MVFEILIRQFQIRAGNAGVPPALALYTQAGRPRSRQAALQLIAGSNIQTPLTGWISRGQPDHGLKARG